MPRQGHFSLWLVDTLARLCDGWLEPNTEAYPPTLRGWRRTRLDVAPLTTRGIDWPSLKALTGAGAQAIGLSTLERPEEVQAVLQHGALAAAGDAAGIERATGLRTSGARLQRVVARVCAQAASDAMLNTAGVVELQARLYGTAGDAPPRELVVSAPPRSAVQPDAQGPLPFDAGQAGGARSAAAVVEPAPPLSPPSEDEEMDAVAAKRALRAARMAARTAARAARSALAARDTASARGTWLCRRRSGEASSRKVAIRSARGARSAHSPQTCRALMPQAQS